MSIKNKEETKQKLLDAVGKILIEDGFQNLGINAVANKANISKVLIYRYFNDFDGLLNSFAEQKDYWLNEGSAFTDFLDHAKEKEMRSAAPKLFQNMFIELMKNRELQEIKRWELFENNPVIENIGKMREETGIKQMKKVSEILKQDEKEIQETTAVIIAGLYYLALRSKTTEMFNGINLRTKEGQKRITRAIETILNKLF